MVNAVRNAVVIIGLLCVAGMGLFYFRCHGRGDYSGGRGTIADPYRIATAADLIALGNDPNDYDKHFILCAPIDLSAYTFDQAVIAPDEDDTDERYQGVGFSGSFDGNGHTIGRLCIRGTGCLGLFGVLNAGSVVESLGLVAVDVNGMENYVGGLVAYNEGHVSACYVIGMVTGMKDYVGGLVGSNRGRISNCYSTGRVTGTGSPVGGLAGTNTGSISKSLWDRDTSEQETSQGGEGLTTAAMQDSHTYLNQGWDFVGETANGTEDIWLMPENDYPVHSWKIGMMD